MIKETVAVNIAVMDYGYSEIRMHTAELQEGCQNEDIEAWLEEHDEKYDASTCYYMCSKHGIEVLYE